METAPNSPSMAEAVEVTLEKGIVHRDLKPPQRHGRTGGDAIEDEPPVINFYAANWLSG